MYLETFENPSIISKVGWCSTFSVMQIKMDVFGWSPLQLKQGCCRNTGGECKRQQEEKNPMRFWSANTSYPCDHCSSVSMLLPDSSSTTSSFSDAFIQAERARLNTHRFCSVPPSSTVRDGPHAQWNSAQHFMVFIETHQYNNIQYHNNSNIKKIIPHCVSVTMCSINKSRSIQSNSMLSCMLYC